MEELTTNHEEDTLVETKQVVDLATIMKGDCPNCGQPLTGSHCDTCGG